MASSPFVIFTRHDTKTGKNYFCAKFQRPDGTMASRPMEDMFPFLSREEFYQNMLIEPIPED